MVELRLKAFKMRLVEEADAEFIVALRTDEGLARHLHQTSADVAAQRKWIRSYKKRERNKQEFYFIAESYNGEKLGLNRLYNFRNDTYELGSWIFKKGLPESVPVLADLAVRDFAFDQLGFTTCAFDVRKENKSVVRYHQMFRPSLVREDDLNFYFELPVETYRKHKQKLIKILEHGQ